MCIWFYFYFRSSSSSYLFYFIAYCYTELSFGSCDAHISHFAGLIKGFLILKIVLVCSHDEAANADNDHVLWQLLKHNDTHFSWETADPKRHCDDEYII